MIDQLYQIFARLFRGMKPWALVAPWEQGIRVRLGKWTKRLNPGPHIRIPFMDDVIVQSVRIRLTSMGQQTIMLKSGKVLNVTASLGYRVSDILALYSSLHNVELTLNSLVQSCIADVVMDSDEIQAAELSAKVKCCVDNLDLKSKGIEVTHVAVTDMSVVKAYRLINDYKIHPYTGRSFSTQYDN